MSQHPTLQRPKQRIYLFILFLLLLLFMAFAREWEYDEAWSYMGIQQSGFADIIRYTTFRFANNHLINSLYFKVLEDLGLRQVFFYRLLSIAGFVLFYVAASGILRILRINAYFIVFLLVTPFFLHFSLGRGYSLAIGCFAMSLLYLLKYLDDPQIKYEYAIVLYGAVATLSIFSFLFGFLAICLLLALVKLKQRKDIHTLILLLITGAVVYYVYRVGKIINNFDPDIVGSDSLTKSGTVSSIFTDLSYFSGLKYFGWYKYLKIAVILFCVVLLAIGWRRKTDMRQKRLLLLALIVISLLLMIAAHIGAGAKYPMGRAVFYLEFLLLLVVIPPIAASSGSSLRYVPLLVLAFGSLYHIVELNYEFKHPGFQTMLDRTGNKPLYTLTIDPAVYLVNQFDFQKPNLYQYKSARDLLPLIQKDSSATRFLLYPADHRDSLKTLAFRDLFPCREGFVLAEIAPPGTVRQPAPTQP